MAGRGCATCHSAPGSRGLRLRTGEVIFVGMSGPARFVGVGAFVARASRLRPTAGAHGGADDRWETNYLTELAGVEGDAGGVDAEVVELGRRIEVTRTTAGEVLVIGYAGEPYLRLDADGVWENVNSPSLYLNRDRFASTAPPPTATGDAVADWRLASAGRSVRWHDHRAHWMATVPPPAVAADPGRRQQIEGDHRIELRVDGRPVALLLTVTWVPPPSSRPAWLAAAGLVAAAGALLLARRRDVAGPAVAVAVAAALVDLGMWADRRRLIIGAVVAALGVVLVVLRRFPLRRAGVVLAGLAAAVLAFSRFGVFGHSLIWGVQPDVTRASVAVGCGLALGGAIAAVLGSPLLIPRAKGQIPRRSEGADATTS